jgi:hypothetical protein
MEDEASDSEYSYQSHAPVGSSLADLSNVPEEVEPVPYDSYLDDMDDFFDPDDFDFIEKWNEDILELPDNFFGDDLTNIGSLLDIMMPKKIEGLRPVELKHQPCTNYPKDHKDRTLIHLNEFVGRKGIIKECGRELFYHVQGKEKQYIGTVLRSTGKSVRFSAKGIWDRANRYNEETSNKGSGLGFSMFLHMASCLGLARSGRGVLEPDEGGDVLVNEVLIEVGGESWRLKREKTHADWVIGKYLLLSASVPQLNETDYFKLAVGEDKQDIGTYWNSNLDTGYSPYTTVVRELGRELESQTTRQRMALEKQWLSWFSDYVADKRDLHYEVKLPVLDNAVFWNFLKETSKKGLVPSPFKVLCSFKCEHLTLMKNIARRDLFVYVYEFTNNQSTYHVNDYTSDPTALLWTRVPYVPQREFETGVIHEAKLQYLLRFSSFQYAYLMSELYPKILGKTGCFYSIYSRVGISWCRKKRSSLIWDVCYYMFDEPPPQEYVGKWEKIIKPSHVYYRGPTFKVSRNDIHFASALPYRYLNMHAATIPLIPTGRVRATEEILSRVLMSWCDSTWRTSVIAGTSRFTTCCHMSQSGDLQALFEKGLLHKHPLRFPDFLLIRLIITYIDEHKYVSHTETPLFRLPTPLMSLEKDLPQGMNWHVRKADHDNACMDKIIDNQREEIANRAKRLSYLQEQLNYLRKGRVEGRTQDDYNRLMNTDPGCITFNVLMFAALSRLSAKGFDKIGKGSASQKFALWPLMTDHHSVEIKHEVKQARVRELLSSLVKSTKTEHGIYELLTKQLDKDFGPIPQVFAMHMKDAKSADRDISIMDINMRPSQYFIESLVSYYNNSTDSDMMTDPQKYTKVVEMCMSALQRRGASILSSEDRSNFCGFMHPELMGLGVFIAGQELQSTGLIAAGSMLTANTKRKIVFPSGFTKIEKLEGLDFDMMIRQEGKERRKVPTITTYMHMMQGIYANTGGLINTTTVLGLNASMKIITDSLVLTDCATTSDDVVRVINFRRTMDVQDVKLAAVQIPNTLLKLSMMKENITKPIISTNLAEFNNIVITKDGMVPQSPIHSTLILQPLLGATPMGDLVTVVNNARSSLFWGDPPDLAESALFGGLEMFRQKWIVSTEKMDLLDQYSIIPGDISELVSGFFPRSQRMQNAMWMSLEDDVKEQVKLGMMSLANAMHIFAEPVNKKAKKSSKITGIPDTLHRFSRICNSIGLARKVATRLNPRYIQPAPVAKRREAFIRTMDLLEVEAPEIDQETLDMISPPKVRVHLERHRKRDQQPSNMGMSTHVDLPDLSKIRVSRFCKVSVGTLLTEEEKRITLLEDDDFEKEETKLERIARIKGMSFKSPGGMPLCRIFDGRIFKVPMSFNFSISLGLPQQYIEKPFQYRGVLVKDFMPCLWGDDSLDFTNGLPLAFGHGRVNDTLCAFFKQRRRPIVAVEIADTTEPQVVETRIGLEIAVFTGLDESPIGVHNFKDRQALDIYLPGVNGDLTSMLNYGSYVLSQQRGGFANYRQLYCERKCEMPLFVQKHMLPYPTYLEPKTKIKTANTIILVGSHCCLHLELEVDDTDQGTTTIDLCADNPRVVEPRQRARSSFKRRT